MGITADSDIRQQSVSQEGIRAILSSTPIAAQADLLWQLANEYAIDANWAISYMWWESGYGTANTFSLSDNNLWDILCYPGQWGADGCYQPGNGYSYATYPDMATGLEAGFRLWASYVAQGLTTWGATLSMALCGAPSCSSDWVSKVIGTGDSNATAYPYQTGGGGLGCPPYCFAPVPPETAMGTLLGVLLLGTALVILARRR